MCFVLMFVARVYVRGRDNADEAERSINAAIHGDEGTARIVTHISGLWWFKTATLLDLLVLQPFRIYDSQIAALSGLAFNFVAYIVLCLALQGRSPVTQVVGDQQPAVTRQGVGRPDAFANSSPGRRSRVRARP